jgi:hypothetical protein
MSIRKALEIRKKFTVEQHQFVKEQKIEGENTPAGWVDFFEELAEFDSYVDSAKNRTRNIAILCGVLSFFSIIASAATAGFLAPLMFLLFLLTAIYIAIYFGLEKVDIPNRMRFLVFPLIRVLQEEMKNEAKLYLKVNFKTGLTKPFETKKVEGKYDSKIKKKVDMAFYDYPVLELKAKLADGTGLAVTIDEVARKNDIRKTNYRGKTKYKTKYKIKTSIEVTLTAKEASYQYIDKNPQAQAAKPLLHYNHKADKHIISSKQVQISTDGEAIPKLDIVLNAIATTYQKLKPVA